MKIAIAILNWNGRNLLEAYLPTVLEHSPNADIYLIDNASSDTSVSFVRETHPSIKIIENDDNYGFAGGYNQGLKNIDADIYCLLNSDVAVTPKWLDAIKETFKNMGDLGIVQPKIKDLNNKDHFEYAGAAGGFMDKLGYPFCRGRIFQSIEKDEGQYNDTRQIFWATGACLFIRAPLFWQLGGFDEDYFAHQEEVDLCWRAQNLGQKVYYVGHSHVYHLGGSTLDNMNPKKTFLNFRNSLYSILKNLPRRKALVIVFIRLLLDGVAAIYFLLQSKPKHTWAVLVAHASFYKHFSRIYAKREKTTFVAKYYVANSIVWSYFVNKVNKFNILVKD